MLPNSNVLRYVFFSFVLLHAMQCLKRYVYMGKSIDFRDIVLLQSGNTANMHNSMMTNRNSSESNRQLIQKHNVAAVLFEHRPLKEIPFILYHYHSVLPIDVTLLVFHSRFNAAKLPKLDSYPLYNNVKRNIVYVETGLGNISRSFYNTYMKSYKFWKEDLKGYDYVIIFQTDTLICSDNVHENAISM